MMNCFGVLIAEVCSSLMEYLTKSGLKKP